MLPFPGLRHCTAQARRRLLADAAPTPSLALAPLAARAAQRRPEVEAFGEMLPSTLAHIPGLEWFVRGPDGRRSVPPPPGGARAPSANFITGG